MPSQIMDQRGVSASSHYYDGFHSTAEKHVGFRKLNAANDNLVIGGLMPINGSKLVGPTPIEKFSSIDAEDHLGLGLPASTLVREEMKKPRSGEQGFPNLPRNSWTSVDSQPNTWSSLYLQSTSPGLNGETDTCGIGGEGSLFTSSLSELFSRKLRLSRNDAVSREPANAVTSEEDLEPFESLEEIEARTIGNLLPDADDLFSGVIDEVRNNSHASSGDELEDFDLFSSGGGMEIEGDYQRTGQRGLNSVFVGGHLGGEYPSRTLIVQNINSNIEDAELKALFEQYGDLQSLDTTCKLRGFVVVSYYDIRAAQNAFRSLQGKVFWRQNLHVLHSIRKGNLSGGDFNKTTLIVSNLDSSVAKNELHRIFGAYGEIKEIREITHKNHLKFLEFYDVRAAEAALFSLNGREIAGKQIEIERGHLRDEFDGLSLRHMASVSSGVIASSCIDSGPNKVLTNLAWSPVNSYIEPNRSSGIPVDLLSPAKVIPMDKPIGSQEPSQSTNGLKFGNQAMRDLHHQSFPEYREAFANGSPYTASRTFMEMVGNGVKLNGGLNSGFSGVAVSNGHPVGLSPQGFGSLGNRQVIHGNHNIWSNNSQQQHSPNSVIWPHSPSGINGVHPHHFSPIAAFPRAPPMLMKVGSPAHHHINPTLWDRRHAYLGESPEASRFHQGSPSHPMEISPHNTYARVAGNCLDMPAINVGPRSPHVFSGRNSMVLGPSSYDSPNERGRNFSNRRSESSSNNADKKQFELDIDRILRGEDNRTTLMIKNIPNKYTSKMLLAAIDEHCKGTYDFIYLPIDFKNKCNVGYAFINMTDPQKIIPFHKAFDGKKWEKFNSEKVASLAYARIQGKAALISHFQNSSLMNEDKRCRPILFHTDGPNAGDQEPFPMGTNIRLRAGKPRTLNNNNNNNNNNIDDSYSHGSSSVSPSKSS